MVIAVTGRSGSGKSTYSRKISEMLGGVHVNIDLIVHNQIINNRAIVCNALSIKDFNSVSEIGEIIFSNRDKYESLVKLLWGESLKLILDEVKSNKITILDHILLPHMKELWNISDIKILVKCPEHIRYTRVLMRDKISLEYLMKRESFSIEYNESEFDNIFLAARCKGFTEN